jgi:hypothetical protein
MASRPIPGSWFNAKLTGYSFVGCAFICFMFEYGFYFAAAPVAAMNNPFLVPPAQRNRPCGSFLVMNKDWENYRAKPTPAKA